ncbi:sugar phosphate isomerase/epimerase [Acutalibacter sp. JLR.KK004]|jgi:inosose dehydratase|uniref:sugar phosphate isomerase/epimerase family protein n=1 Tax=Acutalibacter sp. JLR.KK004 TaxID=3112622 RepID=UPI0021733847|nr:TIM barrel protein [Acutalibacter sp.]
MKAAYTGWTWIASREPEEAKKQLEQSFKECKFLGYDTVENFAFLRDFFAENPQELVDMTKRCGVELVNLYGHFTLDVEESLRIAMEQVDFLSAIGGKWYNCQHGGFGEEPYERPTNPEMLDKICEISNRLGEYAKGKGVTVCFHPHFGTCVFSQSDIDYFAAHTKPEYVSFCLDTAHTTLAGINPAALIRQYGDRIAFMHLKDVDTYALSKAEGREKMASFRALGHGTVDFPAVKAALEEAGFDGVLCVELDRPEVCNFHSAEVSRIYLRDVLGI